MMILPPISYRFELLSLLQKRFRPSDPDTMIIAALEAIASPGGKNFSQNAEDFLNGGRFLDRLHFLTVLMGLYLAKESLEN